MKIFPAWMYDDPAIAAERLEGIELRAEERARVRQILREEEARAAIRVKYGLLSANTARLIKRERIQALVRAALKGRK
jgi:archaeosine-15-forming tRNA-guanine transglycosylase